MEGLTPIQKYYYSHKLCTDCGYEYDQCICKDEVEMDIDYEQMLIQSLEREV